MGGAVQGDAAGDSIYRAVLGFPGRGMDGGQTMASAPKGTRRSFGGGGELGAGAHRSLSRGARASAEEEEKTTGAPAYSWDPPGGDSRKRQVGGGL
jgi:hypothetical protein